jgi:hypothetical protein
MLARGRGKSLLVGAGFAVFLTCLCFLGFNSEVAGFARTHGLLGPLGSAAPDFFYSPAGFAGALAVPLGFGYAAVLAGARLITYEHVPSQMQGRVFAFQGVLTSIASIVPLLLVGAMTRVLEPSVVLVLIAAGDIAALVYARATLPRRRGTVAVAVLPRTGARP